MQLHMYMYLYKLCLTLVTEEFGVALTVYSGLYSGDTEFES